MENRKSKQVIVIRKDLNMRKGKMVAQGAHASMSAILNFKQIKITLRNLIHNRKALRDWFLGGSFTKICASVNSEAELLLLYSQAQDKGLICSLIRDSGKTEFNGVQTYTAVAIGPAWEDEVDEITGNLPLL